jgi:hypothetical protein
MTIAEEEEWEARLAAAELLGFRLGDESAATGPGVSESVE